MTSVPRYALGVLGLAIVLIGPGWAGVALKRRLLPTWHGAEALLATSFLALALLIGTLEFLGTIRLFSPLPIVLACAAMGAFAARHAPIAAPPGRSPSNAAVLAGAATVLVGAEWLIPALDSLSHGIRTVDTLWYHLPWAASFAHAGQITTLRFTDIEYPTAFYPATAEMLHGAGIALLGRDTLSPLINLGWLGLEVLAAWCVGARRGRGAACALAAAVVLATTMMDLSQAGSAANDIVGIFFLTAAVAFWLGEAPPWLPALAAGLAVGTKLSLAAPAVALVLVGLIDARNGKERLRRAAALWLGGLGIGGGFWFVRNLIAVGSPVPWWNLPGLAAPAPALQAHTGYSVSHYLTSTTTWSRFLTPGLHAGIGVGWPLLLILAVLAPLALLVTGSGRPRLLGAIALLSLAAYLVTPETAAGPAGDPVGFAFNLRYAAPALTMCLVCLALVPRVGRAGCALLGLLLVLDVARGNVWGGEHVAEAVLLAVVAGALAVAAGAGRRHRRPAAVGLTLGLGVAIAVAGYFVQRSYLRGRYRYSPGVSQMSAVWAAFRHVHGARVALSGTFGGYFQYPLWGVDDSNPVSYVAEHGPHGSFTAISSCRAWRRALNAGHYRYLVATPSRDPWHPHVLTPSPEAGWTRGDPHARVVLVHRGAGAAIYVLRLTGMLDPNGCE